MGYKIPTNPFEAVLMQGQVANQSKSTFYPL